MVTGTRDFNTDPDCSGATNFLQQLKPGQHHGHEWEGGPHRLAVSTRGMSLRPKHAQKLGIPVGLGSNVGHTHQHRPMLHAVGPRTPPPKKKKSLAAAPAQMSPYTLVAAQAIQISITTAAGLPLATNMAPGGGPDPRHPYSFIW